MKFSGPAIVPRPLFIVALVVLAALGCDRDEDYSRLDFSQTQTKANSQTPSAQGKVLRVAIGAMISPQETINYYDDMMAYLGKRAGTGISVIQRKTYQEINELFSAGQADMAFICTGPYVLGRKKYGFEALATPVIRGQPLYQSYLIVGKNSLFLSLSDLKGKSFAMTDPDSLTGALAPRFWLAKVGLKPENFFGKLIYTYSHDNSIFAVARGLVDAAAVDGHKWEYFERTKPRFTRLTRILMKSEPFGSPPAVVSSSLSPEIKEKIRLGLLTMHENPEGREILAKLMIDRFVEPDEKWYEPVSSMYKSVENTGKGDSRGSEKP
ncbi:MAG: phosphate/phosphite/phosphonate ABC transporter substrate-binding protein [Deltaproteobacteria bacterium]|nr:phosphate/phosphite/phosphonate ABC transporter substrate-binding protein [Deltaproteobacteria bacterium]